MYASFRQQWNENKLTKKKQILESCEGLFRRSDFHWCHIAREIVIFCYRLSIVYRH